MFNNTLSIGYEKYYFYMKLNVSIKLDLNN